MQEGKEVTFKQALNECDAIVHELAAHTGNIIAKNIDQQVMKTLENQPSIQFPILEDNCYAVTLNYNDIPALFRLVRLAKGAFDARNSRYGELLVADFMERYEKLLSGASRSEIGILKFIAKDLKTGEIVNPFEPSADGYITGFYFFEEQGIRELNKDSIGEGHHNTWQILWDC